MWINSAVTDSVADKQGKQPAITGLTIQQWLFHVQLLKPFDQRILKCHWMQSMRLFGNNNDTLKDDGMTKVFVYGASFLLKKDDQEDCKLCRRDQTRCPLLHIVQITKVSFSLYLII